MWRRWGNHVPALASLTLAGAAGLCELAERADGACKPEYAKRQLLALRDAAEEAETEAEAAVSSRSSTTKTTKAWLDAETPRFPYLLAISPGDDPVVVTDNVLHGALAIGSRERSAGEMARQLCCAPTLLGHALQSVAARWSELKAALHAPDLPDAFDPRVSPTDVAQSAIVAALKQLHEEDSRYPMDADASTDESIDASAAQQGPPTRRFAFVLTGFDDMDDSQAEKWLQWTDEVTSSGLAHVVVPTRRAVTPERVQWLQARYQARHADGGFVAVLLRVAKEAVDQSTAENKVHKVASSLGLELLSQPEDDSEDARNDEVAIIIESAGNWWADICDVCARLIHSGLADITDKEARLGVIRAVCDEFIKETGEFLASQALALDKDLGKLHALRQAVGDSAATPSASSEEIKVAQDRALDSLDAWRCLEVVSGLPSATGGGRAGVMGSAQELLTRRDLPPNCVRPVDALLAFNSRPEGERKFLDLLDLDVLLVRPKTAVEIGVVPCETTALLSPCWIEVRPAVKRAFEKLWRDDEYFAVVQALERLSTSLHLLDEVGIFRQEIADRQQVLDDMQHEFELRQSALSAADRAQRRAEIALTQLELDAKRVYLERLRSLLG